MSTLKQLLIFLLALMLIPCFASAQTDTFDEEAYFDELCRNYSQFSGVECLTGEIQNELGYLSLIYDLDNNEIIMMYGPRGAGSFRFAHWFPLTDKQADSIWSYYYADFKFALVYLAMDGEAGCSFSIICNGEQMDAFDKDEAAKLYHIIQQVTESRQSSVEPAPTDSEPTAAPQSTQRPLPNDTSLRCSACRGTGSISKRCTACNGSGRDRCSSCAGEGYNRCSSCGGDGSYQCTACRGSGTTSKDRRCSSCSGAGEKRCSPCSGAGEKRCNLCRGAGSKECHYCSGQGSKSSQCTGCHGTGTV